MLMDAHYSSLYLNSVGVDLLSIVADESLK